MVNISTPRPLATPLNGTVRVAVVIPSLEVWLSAPGSRRLRPVRCIAVRCWEGPLWRFHAYGDISTKLTFESAPQETQPSTHTSSVSGSQKEEDDLTAGRHKQPKKIVVTSAIPTVMQLILQCIAPSLPPSPPPLGW